MQIVFDVTPARKSDFGYQMCFSLKNGPDPLRRVVEVANAKALAPLWEDFKREADATGKPYAVTMRQHPRDKARKFPGFNKAADLQHFTPAAYTVTEEELHDFAD